MLTLISVLVNIVLPVFLIIGAGFLTARVKSLDAHTLSRIALYVMGPALVFSKLVETTVTRTDLVQIVVFTVAGTLLGLLLSWVVARLMRLDQSTESAFVLSSSFVNSGNYGLPLVLFAFGQQGLERALIYFVTSAFIVNTLAVFVASRGKARVTTSFLNIFRVPMIYAIAAAFAVRASGFVVPGFIFQPLEMVGDAAIPLMLLLVGVQLARSSIRSQLGLICAATSVRLVGGAAVGIVLGALLGLSGVTRQTCIVEHATPTGVMTSILAMEFGTDPEFVTGVIFATTLASIATMTLLVAWLG
jgi:predicted permease